MSLKLSTAANTNPSDSRTARAVLRALLRAALEQPSVALYSPLEEYHHSGWGRHRYRAAEETGNALRKYFRHTSARAVLNGDASSCSGSFGPLLANAGFFRSTEPAVPSSSESDPAEQGTTAPSICIVSGKRVAAAIMEEARSIAMGGVAAAEIECSAEERGLEHPGVSVEGTKGEAKGENTLDRAFRGLRALRSSNALRHTHAVATTRGVRVEVSTGFNMGQLEVLEQIWKHHSIRQAQQQQLDNESNNDKTNDVDATDKDDKDAGLGGAKSGQRTVTVEAVAPPTATGMGSETRGRPSSSPGSESGSESGKMPPNFPYTYRVRVSNLGNHPV